MTFNDQIFIKTCILSSIILAEKNVQFATFFSSNVNTETHKLLCFASFSFSWNCVLWLNKHLFVQSSLRLFNVFFSDFLSYTKPGKLYENSCCFRIWQNIKTVYLFETQSSNKKTSCANEIMSNTWKRNETLIYFNFFLGEYR